MPPFKHWMKHTAMVPKGFLRYQVLRFLAEKPMSGSELMSEIEKRTNKYWKPSPGSIYPLLAWMRDNGYIVEAPQKEVGIKRYTLTDKGKGFLEEHIKTHEEMRKRFQHFRSGSGFVGPMWFELYSEKTEELRKATRDLAAALRKLQDKLEEKYSEEVVEEAKKTLKEVTERIQDITEKA